MPPTQSPPKAQSLPPMYKPRPKRQSENSWLWITLLSGVISGLLLFTVGWFWSLTNVEKTSVIKNILSVTDVFPNIVGLNQSQVILVMGVDMPSHHGRQADLKADYSGVRTDTMMLVKLDPAHKKANIVSIPRDSKVYIANNLGVNKINAAFPLGGPQTAVQTVEESFGVRIDHYLIINLAGVRDLVEALGGIDVYVDRPMHYRDYTAKLNINLDPGLHHLDGREAEGFLRFRHDALGDIGRIRRQQAFIAGFSNKLKDPATLLKIKPLIDVTNSHLITDMTTGQLASLALFGKDLRKDSFQVATLPGRPSQYGAVSYWIVDSPGAEAVLNRMIVGVSPQGEMVGGRHSVGLLYAASQSENLAAVESALSADGFDVSCRRRLRRAGSSVISHNADLPKSVETDLLKTLPSLRQAQRIFAPHGSTYENNACGATDFTVVLGDDL